MNRRDFLKTAGGVAAILGLPSLALGQDDSPEWLRQALARMKKENKFGLAIRVPADYDQRFELSRKLLELLRSEKDEMVELLSSSVLVCLGGKSFPGRDGEALALLDLDGKRVDGAKSLEFPTLLTDDRIRERAEAIRKTVDVSKTLEALEGDLEEAAAATAKLEKLAPAIAPLLVYEHRQSKGEVRDRLMAVLQRYVAEFEGKEPGPRLPFGVECKDHTGCSEEPYSKCGRSSMPQPARKFLEFLAKT